LELAARSPSAIDAQVLLSTCQRELGEALLRENDKDGARTLLENSFTIFDRQFEHSPAKTSMRIELILNQISQIRLMVEVGSDWNRVSSFVDSIETTTDALAKAITGGREVQAGFRKLYEHVAKLREAVKRGLDEEGDENHGSVSS
jgi:hypothetical protein